VGRCVARRLAGRGGTRRATSTTLAEIKRNLRIFVWRFFKTSQFKRSLRAERAEGRQRRLAVAARRLARAERFGSHGLAGPISE
jgi:hypothetical protein